MPISKNKHPVKKINQKTKDGKDHFESTPYRQIVHDRKNYFALV